MRCDARHNSNAAYSTTLDIEEKPGSDAFRITDTPNGVRITGNSETGLLAGTGKYLRTCTYDETGFDPSSWRGESTAAGDMRGIYFATHFMNWYEAAPVDELRQYIEDLSLWGMNNLMLAFPMQHLTGWDDPGIERFFKRFRMLRDICHGLGIRIGHLLVPNHDFFHPREEFANTPNRDDFKRKGDNGNNVCPSIPGATEYVTRNFEEILRRHESAPPDFTGFWPYDEGGCGCDACYPWGGNGYVRLCRDFTERARAAFPDIDIILSTWVFDTPEAGEWEALARSMDDGPWVDYILADAHEDFPRYPLDVEVPGGLPLISFPEISMWALGPWGGFGANPLPERLQRLWDQVKHVVRGGFPYSEGIFEDTNKAVALQFYWNPDHTADGTLREYVSYECPGADVDEVIEMIAGIEVNQTRVAAGNPPDTDLTEEVLAKANHIDANISIPKAWRWRILYMRAVLDNERYAVTFEGDWSPHLDWTNLLADNATAQTAMRELMDIFLCMDIIDETHHEHAWVSPPIAR
jgi:hypothetical protein